MTGCPDVMNENELPHILDVFSHLQQSGYLELPVIPEAVFVVEDRIPNIRIASKSKSLLNQLTDREAETGVVVDASLSGKNALFLASLLSSKEECIGWTNVMFEVRFLTIEKIKDTYLVVASLASFVPLRDAT